LRFIPVVVGDADGMMEASMRKIVLAALAGIAALTATGAQAQERPYDGGPYGYAYREGRENYGVRNYTRTGGYVCAGNRARDVDADIERQRDAGGISGYQAARMHAQVSRYDDQTRYACDRGDWRAVTAIAGRYDEMQRMLSGYRY
jgi:hypothetical protein